MEDGDGGGIRKIIETARDKCFTIKFLIKCKLRYCYYCNNGKKVLKEIRKIAVLRSIIKSERAVFLKGANSGPLSRKKSGLRAGSMVARCYYNTKWRIPRHRHIRWTHRDDVSPRGQQWQNPSIVLKSWRTNVRLNSSINLQVNQPAASCRQPFSPCAST